MKSKIDRRFIRKPSDKAMVWNAFARTFVPIGEPDHRLGPIDQGNWADYPHRLLGAGHNHMAKPRGFKGSKFGAANAGRRLSSSERAAVAAQLKAAGKI
jgi:hypothetical protein